MSFSIRFTNKELPDNLGKDFQGLMVEVRINDFIEDDIVGTDYWTKSEHLEQWLDAINLITNKDNSKAGLVMSIEDRGVSWWTLYRDGEAVYIRNQMSVEEEQINILNLYEHVNERIAGEKVSEWKVSLDDIKKFSNELKTQIPKSRDSTFVVSLAIDDMPHTVPRLLRHAMKSLRRETEGYPIYIHQLQLENPYTDDEQHGILCSYWEKTEDSAQLDKSNIDYRGKFKIAAKVDSIKYFPEDKKSPLMLLEYRLPQDDSQNDTIKLIESLADYLEENRIEDILDLVFEDWLDDDAIQHPFVRVYYKN